MSFWVERNAAGFVLASYSGGDEQPALLGGIVVEVDRACVPSQCLYLHGELIDLGPAPTLDHVRDIPTRAWVVPGVTQLELAQVAKWIEIRAERDRRETGGFPHAGKVFDSDPTSVQRISGAAQAAQLAMATASPFAITWVCMDNTTIDLDAAGMVGVLVAMFTYVGGLHETARALRAQIYDAEATPESVAAVSWPAQPP